jgi:5'-phosphate synthase pdxT subunit
VQVGVLAIQGDFEKHQDALRRSGVNSQDILQVRTQTDLSKVDRLIIPGGESTTVGKLLARFGLGEDIKRAAAKGMPIWGTCMGMIMLAERVENRDQYSLGLLDITVRRNAFGAQVHSFQAQLNITGISSSVDALFIRAPIVTELGPGVKPICEFEDKIVAVQQGSIVGTSFHPELTNETAFHKWFLAVDAQKMEAL